MVDDGSTDQTASIVSRLAEKFPNIVLFSKANNGPGAARNSGLKIAKGEYILFVDADDYVISGTISYLVCLAKKGDLDILMGDFLNEKLGNTPVKNLNFRLNSQEIMTGKEFLKANEISWAVWVYFFKKDFLYRHKLFFREKLIFNDVDFSLKSIFYASRIQYKKVFFYSWVFREFSMSHSNWTKQKLMDEVSGLAAVKSFALSVKSEDEGVHAIFCRHMTAQSIGIIKRSASFGLSEIRLACKFVRDECINEKLYKNNNLRSHLIYFLIILSPSLAAIFVFLAKYIYKVFKYIGEKRLIC